jgi:hypothetical protein
MLAWHAQWTRRNNVVNPLLKMLLPQSGPVFGQKEYGMKITHASGMLFGTRPLATARTLTWGCFSHCVCKKNSELPDGSPTNKYKGRVGFQGNRVSDQNYDIAISKILVVPRLQ